MFGIPVVSDARRRSTAVNRESAVVYSFSRTRTSASHGSEVRRIAVACVNMRIWVGCTATQISRGIEEEGDTTC